MKLFYSKITKIFLLYFLLVFICRCSDEKYTIPNVEVNAIIDKATVLQISPGNAIYYNGGIKGLIICTDGFNYSAYERLCTNYPNEECAVEIDNDTNSAKCPCCGSVFSLLLNGDVITPPARWALKKYRTYLDPSGRLSITN